MIIIIEDKIFKKSNVITDKLIPYGFIKKDNKYIYQTNIINNNFMVEIEIINNKVSGKIIDLSFNEEYTNFRINDLTGDFVSKIRTEYENILLDIRHNCFIENYFISNQSNRITNIIIEKYNTYPEFLWEKTPDCGIFRNKLNQKWYGIIMNIPKNKLDKKSTEENVEIINLKVSEDKISNLIKLEGYYRAYHMNKKNWITIILNDTLKDEEILSYIEESYNLINSSK